MGLKDQILAYDDRPIEKVPVPEWGGMLVPIRGLTSKQRDEFEKSYVMKTKKGLEVDDRGLSNVRARLVSLCAMDETGNLMFNADEADVLGAKSASALNRLYDVARRLSGLTKEDVEELEKN
jgi:hypothetical protein